jgi:hypothetical protein
MTREEAEAQVRAALGPLNGALLDAYKAGHPVELVSVNDDRLGVLYAMRCDIDKLLRGN